MFYALGGVALRGYDLITATANAKVLNCTSNIASLIVFILGGKVVWVAGLTMIGGQLIGGYLGGIVIVKGGSAFIRPVIIFMCFAMLIKYGLDKGLF